MGVAVAQSAIAPREKSPPPTEDVIVTRSTDQAAPDVKGTFYCQAGDHIVDHTVWLETITLGCRPCMEKLGRSISTEDWTPRLWVSTPEGTKRAEDIPPLPKPAAPTRSKTKKTWRGTPLSYIAEHQDWTCSVCHQTRDKMDGFYNTATGFTCQECTPSTPMDDSQTSTSMRIARARTRAEAEEALRHKKIIRRQSDQIFDTDPLKQALSAVTYTQGVANSVAKSGHNAVIDLPSVAPGQRVEVTGHNGAIRITGDVGAGARVIATGHNANIKIGGHVWQNAVVEARGHNATVRYQTREYSAHVQAEGHNGVVRGRAEPRKLPNQAEQARAELARKYNLPYPEDSDSFEQFDMWMGAKEKMASSVGQLQAKMFVCTCVRCGKLDVDNPVLGGSEILNAQYKCSDCIQARSRPGIPAHRQEDLSRLTNLQVLQSVAHLPRSGRVGDHIYLAEVDKLYSWLDSSYGWVQVSMPSRYEPPVAPKTPAHEHVWLDLWGERGKFCKQCGARA